MNKLGTSLRNNKNLLKSLLLFFLFWFSGIHLSIMYEIIIPVAIKINIKNNKN